MSSFSVSSDQADRRLDRVIRGLFKDVPLGVIMKAVRTGLVRVNGARTDVSCRLSIGDLVTTPWQLNFTPDLPAEKTGGCRQRLQTVYRDSSVWCIDKPPGLLSQPDKKNADSVITRAWSELGWSRIDFKPAVIQRLDRNVSGLITIAMDAPTLRLLSALMRENLIRKIYRAVVTGKPPSSGEIDLPLAKDEQNNSVYVDRVFGRAALTRFVTLQSSAHHSLVELELVTGRPHQARVHLSSIGHPIVGDFKYSEEERRKQSKESNREGRLYLHALSITLPDSSELQRDISGKTFSTAMPDDFNKYL